MADTSGYSQQDPQDSASEWRERQFQIERTLARVRTVVPCEIKSVSPGSGTPPGQGTVSVQPMIKMIDGQGNVSSHGIINNIPVFRLGCGNGAIVCDPVVGDIGWLAVADRDTSAFKNNNGAESQPGSRRKFDMADGVYLGTLLAGSPSQYVQFTSSGIKISDKNGNVILMNSSGVSINGVIINLNGQVAGNLSVTGALALNGGIVSLTGATYTGNILTSGGIEAGVGGADHVTLQLHQHSALNAAPVPGH